MAVCLSVCCGPHVLCGGNALQAVRERSRIHGEHTDTVTQLEELEEEEEEEERPGGGGLSVAVSG